MPSSKFNDKSGKAWKAHYWSYLAILFPILVPTFQVLVYKHLWPKTDVVVEQNCTCDCWDNFFKGSFEEGGISNYKNVYFNSTENTFKIWAVTILFFLGIYEVIKKMIVLHVQDKLRLNLAFLTSNSFHVHYYCWWIMYNYWNDDYDLHWNHLTFFVVTKLISTLILVVYLDGGVTTQPLPLLMVINISILHITFGSWKHVVAPESEQDAQVLHKLILHDLYFISADIMSICICFYELRFLSKIHDTSLQKLVCQQPIIPILGLFTTVMFGWRLTL